MKFKDIEEAIAELDHLHALNCDFPDDCRHIAERYCPDSPAKAAAMQWYLETYNIANRKVPLYITNLRIGGNWVWRKLVSVAASYAL